MFSILLASLSAEAATPTPPQSWLNNEDRAYAVHLSAEVGALLPVSHKIQFDKDGTYFDYVRYGGQDNLFPFLRFSADLDLGDRHTVVFLYQPLSLESTVSLEEELVVDGAVFAAGTPMDLRYGFDFVRASWMYDLQPERKKEFAVGLSLQIRNATIDFRSADGTLQRSNRDIGPVPILKTRIRQPVGETAWWGLELDGFYAPVSYLNGDNNEVVGAILDASGRYGLTLNSGIDTFLNLRYLGGGAVGIDDDSTGPGDGYTRNWLHFASLSLGFMVR
ncbi:MAG: hypothetical protein ACI8RZ_007839 [Myxococcota bacterium]|jgi:hypothetical protein